MRKFNRIYELRVESNTGEWTSIALPYSVEFNVQRNAFAAANNCNIKIYNLGTQTRNKIYKDRWSKSTFENPRAVQFRAGYDNYLGSVFNGTLMSAYSYRVGTDIITELECMDGVQAMAESFSSITLPIGTTSQNAVKFLSGNLKGVNGSPIVSSVFNSVNLKPEVVMGSTWDAIMRKTHGKAFIDNGQVVAIDDNDVINGEVPVISSASGLLESPRRYDANIEFEMLFEPRLRVGQVVKMESQVNEFYNRLWKVNGFSHHGMISPTNSGKCTSRVYLFAGTAEFNTVSANG